MEFTVDLDDRLRAAASGAGPTEAATRHRPASGRHRWTSSLRPRDIQARIRAGETPESVALVRRHVGRQGDAVRRAGARRARPRRPARPARLDPPSPRRGRADLDGPHPRRRRRHPPARPQRRPRRRRLGRLAARGRPLDPDRAPTRPAAGSALPTSRSTPRATTSWPTTTTPTGCSARCRTRPSRRAAAVDRDDLSDARRRRLSAVPPDELPLGEDAHRAGQRDGPVPWPGGAHDRADENAALGAEQPVEASLDDPPPTTDEAATLTADETDDAAEDDLDDADGPDEPAGTSRRRASRSRRPAAAPRSRAGTRSCSVDATTAAPDPLPGPGRPPEQHLWRVLRRTTAWGWWCDQFSITRDQLNGPKLVAVVAACPPGVTVSRRYSSGTVLPCTVTRWKLRDVVRRVAVPGVVAADPVVTGARSALLTAGCPSGRRGSRR